MQVHTNAVIGEKESATSSNTVEQLSSSVGALLQQQAQQKAQVERLTAALSEAREAREAAQRVGDELGVVARDNVAKQDALAQRDEFNNRAIEEVQSNMLANAEQVGEELRARSVAFEQLDAKSAEQAESARGKIRYIYPVYMYVCIYVYICVFV